MSSLPWLLVTTCIVLSIWCWSDKFPRNRHKDAGHNCSCKTEKT